MAKWYLCILLGDVQMANNSGSSSAGSAIIGGVVGGIVLLLMITVVLCIVILCMRRSHIKKGDNKVSYNEDVTIENNPSYDVNEISTIDHSYSLVKPGDSNVSITANSFYNIHTKPCSKTSEDEYNYVQPNEFKQHSDLNETVKMDTDPAYGVITEEDRVTGTTATNSDTTKQYMTICLCS